MTSQNQTPPQGITAEELEAALNRVLDSRVRVENETHAKHHHWIQAQIETQTARKEMYKKAAESAIQWSVVGILAAVWYFFTHGSWPR